MAGKRELVDRITQETGMSKAQAGRVVDTTLNYISETLTSGESLTLPGFGTFRVTNTKERPGRNPATGQSITIPAGKRISFSAGSKLSGSVKGRR